MKRFLQGLVVSGAIAAGASPALAIDPFFPTFGNNGIDAVPLEYRDAMLSYRNTGEASFLREALLGEIREDEAAELQKILNTR